MPNHWRHGYSAAHPTYRVWTDMKRRCVNPKHKAYPRYGARGISVCERWLNDFAAFVADMGEKPEGMTLDRIDNAGPYSPENCRWATWREQNNNRRSTRKLEWDGRTQSLRQWSRELGINHVTLRRRLEHGWTVERALTTPVNQKFRSRK